MKRIVVVLFALIMALSIVSCGQSDEAEEETDVSTGNITIESQNETDTLDSIIENIQTDFDTTINELKDEIEQVYKEVGETYDDYVNNKDYISDWYDQCITTANELYDRTYEASMNYYKTIADEAENMDHDELDDSLDSFKDEIYDTALDSFKDDIYDGIFDDIKDKYYDGIIDDGKESTEYSNWLDEHSDFYSIWLDGRSQIYSDWLNARSKIYSDWLDIRSAFLYDDNFDVNAILAGKEETENEETEEESSEETIEKTEEDTKKETQEETNNKTDSGLSPEFKDMMDSYEEFFDEYVEFMKKYNDSDGSDSLEMLQDLSSYMTKYTETMKKLDNLDEDEMSPEELKYYLEVMDRINKKLATLSE